MKLWLPKGNYKSNAMTGMVAGAQKMGKGTAISKGFARKKGPVAAWATTKGPGAKWAQKKW